MQGAECGWLLCTPDSNAALIWKGSLPQKLPDQIKWSQRKSDFTIQIFFLISEPNWHESESYTGQDIQRFFSEPATPGPAAEGTTSN